MPPWQSSPTPFPGWFHRPEAMQQDGLGTGSPKARVAPGDPNHSPKASKKGKECSASAHAAACTGTDGSCPGVALGTSPRLTLQLLKSLCHSKKNEQERSQAATSPTREFTCRAAHGQQHPRRATQHRLARMALPTLPINPLLQTGTLVCKPPHPRGLTFRLGVQGRTIGPSPLLFQTKDKPGFGIPLRPLGRQAAGRATTLGQGRGFF